MTNLIQQYKEAKTEIYQLKHDGEIVQELNMSDWQCAGISGRQPINEACGGCVGCLFAQANYAGIEFDKVFENEDKIIYATIEMEGKND